MVKDNNCFYYYFYLASYEPIQLDSQPLNCALNQSSLLKLVQPVWYSVAKNHGWLSFYHITLFCLLVCFVSLPGRDKDLSVFLMSRCMCLFKLVAQGWGENQVGQPAENLVNTGQANAKKVCWLNHLCLADCANEMLGIFSFYLQGSLCRWQNVQYF